MPRLISFQDNFTHEESGNEWKIYTVPGFVTPRTYANRGEQIMDVGFREGLNRHRGTGFGEGDRNRHP